ncbi:MAG: DivIVA domain-containing protein, partial [Lactococcus lactis]|nr:DivIVA domain-containing protein [Lactococcus lactis]
MALNSLDVQNKTFNPQFRGFSKHEVDEFLDIVVRDYDEFAKTIKDQERELKALRERVKYFDDMKDSLNKSIVVAQDAADNLREQAKSEADTLKINSEKESAEIIANAGQKSSLIIEAAKKEAGNILNAASDDARKLVRDTDDLKRKMRLYHQRMTSIIENQLASIQSDDWAEIFRPTQDYSINPEEKLQMIIEEHGGRIDVESELGKGTSFIIRL